MSPQFIPFSQPCTSLNFDLCPEAITEHEIAPVTLKEHQVVLQHGLCFLHTLVSELWTLGLGQCNSSIKGDMTVWPIPYLPFIRNSAFSKNISDRGNFWTKAFSFLFVWFSLEVDFVASNLII